MRGREAVSIIFIFSWVWGFLLFIIFAYCSIVDYTQYEYVCQVPINAYAYSLLQIKNKKSKQMTTTATHPLQSLLQKQAKIVTSDGRVFVGVLRGLDQAMNCLLGDCWEHIYSEEQPIRKQNLNTYFVRGDMIVVIGEMVAQNDCEDEHQQGQKNNKGMKCKPLPKFQ